ncbi:hypothetical protein A3709_19770 [Halioglobus sp. HI00S01]|uniref:methyl-accepting chemotaxis protein n=1 Tax=Halioglobus sp. HI00S01 TaxID=1822214 RepID=UPI0007C2C8C4|nr:methyl-accepting chemotaxis protein [Halioglobus sp. HI00S01]KZX57865.1 hypothetical protein A3709_19770 [Halioglobus sp. HI00S01]
MSNMKKSTSKLGVGVGVIGLVVCLGTAGYNWLEAERASQQDERLLREVANLRLALNESSSAARLTVSGDESAFATMNAGVGRISQSLDTLNNAGLTADVRKIRAETNELQSAAGTLSDAEPRIAAINDVSRQLELAIEPIQAQFVAIVDILRDTTDSTETLLSAQNMLWTTERIAANIEKILAGGQGSQASADIFNKDAAAFQRTVDALRKGNSLIGVEPITDPDAKASLNEAVELFSPVSEQIETIYQSAPELRNAALARDVIAAAQAPIGELLVSLPDSIESLNSDKQANERSTQIGVVGAGFFIALLAFFLLQGSNRRQRYQKAGVDEVTGTLKEFADGDFTVKASTDNEGTAAIASSLNSAAQTLKGTLGSMVAKTLEVVKSSVESTRMMEAQVERANTLSSRISESTATATEMVQNSQQISSAAKAQQEVVADAVNAVNAGRETIQQTLKGQDELRQTVQASNKQAKFSGEETAGIIAALSKVTELIGKVGVIAINARIEATKAGEAGLPFTAIANEIAKLNDTAADVIASLESKSKKVETAAAEVINLSERMVEAVVSQSSNLDRVNENLSSIYAFTDNLKESANNVASSAEQSREASNHMLDQFRDMQKANTDMTEMAQATRMEVQGVVQSSLAMQQEVTQFNIGEAAEEMSVDSDDIDELEAPLTQAEAEALEAELERESNGNEPEGFSDEDLEELNELTQQGRSA